MHKTIDINVNEEMMKKIEKSAALLQLSVQRYIELVLLESLESGDLDDSLTG